VLGFGERRRFCVPVYRCTSDVPLERRVDVRGLRQSRRPYQPDALQLQSTSHAPVRSTRVTDPPLREALTNTAKHAQASEVTLGAHVEEGNLRLRIRDDGIGGANAAKGSGLIGLKDRVEALGGHIQVSSPPGIGTTLQLTIPLDNK
jgi:glucose-6-phosphate-specific signal transduction histidine kinase